MGFLSDLAIGAAVIVLPRGNLALLGLTVSIQAVRAVRARKARLRRQSEAGAQLEANGITPATLAFEDVCCVIEPSAKAARKGATDKVLLDGVSGCARPGRLTALMGPSGSGKTTLLNALAGHVPVTKGMRLSGRVRVNGHRLANAGVRVGYVQQEDMFYSQMTVRETLDMAAALRLPPRTPAVERDAAVSAVIQRLGLANASNTVVGDRKTRGLSGGEKKRLAIACELISRPSLLFLDEPTTGLDAFQAQMVMETLKQLARDGHTVIAAIHQPRSSIYALFDDLLLLADGRCVFSGPEADALDHMAAQGLPCPAHYNPAEFLADAIAVDHSSDDAAAASEARVLALVAAAPRPDMPADVSRPQSMAGGFPDEASAGGPRPRAPLRTQLRLLLKRSWRQVTRDKAAIKLRVASNVQSALVFGAIWWRLRRLQRSVASRLGLLQVVAVYMSQSALFKTLNLFPPEKNLVTAERAAGAYDVLPYFLSKLLAEIPVTALFPLVFSAIVYPMTGLQPSVAKFVTFAGSNVLETMSASAMGLAIGAVAPSTDAALVLGPAIMLVFIVFGGLYTNQDDVPACLRWVPDTSQIKRGYDALCQNEFAGLALEAEGPGSYESGEQVLARQGFRGGVCGSLVGQGRILLFHYWLTFCILRAKRPRFQPMAERRAGDE